MKPNTERIRALNDELRRNLPNGHAVITTGVAALGPRIVKTIAVYDDFCHANDPYGEHDFGSFEAAPTRSRHSSASSFAAIPVESTRSQNITVTCRRSPAASGVGGEVEATGGCGFRRRNTRFGNGCVVEPGNCCQHLPPVPKRDAFSAKHSPYSDMPSFSQSDISFVSFALTTKVHPARPWPPSDRACRTLQ
jgi:hypothetical protein